MYIVTEISRTKRPHDDVIRLIRVEPTVLEPSSSGASVCRSHPDIPACPPHGADASCAQDLGQILDRHLLHPFLDARSGPLLQFVTPATDSVDACVFRFGAALWEARPSKRSGRDRSSEIRRSGGTPQTRTERSRAALSVGLTSRRRPKSPGPQVGNAEVQVAPLAWIQVGGVELQGALADATKLCRVELARSILFLGAG